MKYEDFWSFLEDECLYETVYDDTDGCTIVVIRMLDLWGLANKFKQKEKANERTDTTQES